MKDRFLRWCIDKTSRFTAWLYMRQGVPVWRSFDGRVTPITEMSTDHLKNTARMLVRQSVKTGESLPLAYSFILKELTIRMAMDLERPS